jgi:hypothetical protein
LSKTKTKTKVELYAEYDRLCKEEEVLNKSLDEVENQILDLRQRQAALKKDLKKTSRILDGVEKKIQGINLKE